MFAYLDAHWKNDLPLAEEIDLIFSHCAAAVVMIDDFQVPFDGNYQYDNYGAGRALTAAYIEPAIALYDLQTYYPSVPASAETGMRRGCVVLAQNTIHSAALTSLPELRRWETGQTQG